MEKRKVELLAPAGNYESFLGAIHAGADAVYMAGTQFGARAYADNFTQEEVCKAIRYAHLFHRKVYLTVNILLKEDELSDLYEYLEPYYCCGLDGVIVQDLGAFQYMKEHFLGLELHVSTQMTITGAYGAGLLKEMGASRVVPARELSLDEIKEIKKTVAIEIEAFIHGAMCYCYSGSCLFSSILGGRSGNRGRCAQPCRLPYEVLQKGTKVTKGEQYPLSLKDMCTIQMIPELIEAGINSFKIEGRMKKPEYAAGVTALYRKYIDLYYQNPKHFKVSKEDLDTLRKLYMRSELQDGYYKKHNGREMVTLSKPSYSGSEESLLQRIRNTYIEERKQLNVQGTLTLETGKEMLLTVFHKETNTTVQTTGELVQQASNRPLVEDTIQKQLRKTGTTHFIFDDIIVNMKEDVFVSLKAINEIRRQALEALEDTILSGTLRVAIKPESECNHSSDNSGKTGNNVDRKQTESGLSAVASTREQCLELAKHEVVKRVYISSDCLFDREAGNPTDCVRDYASKLTGKELFLAMPYVIRKRSAEYLNSIAVVLQETVISGVLVRNLETLGWLKQIGYQGKIITDAGLYCFNRKAKEVLQKMVFRETVPYELNLGELVRLGIRDMEIPIYGRIPMMITANCVQKTVLQCRNGQDNRSEDTILWLKDRYQKQFPIVRNCRHCYNVIYNSQPTSLHAYAERFQESSIRLDFTIENEKETADVVRFFEMIYKKRAGEGKQKPPYQEFTKGHVGRGVE